MVVSKRCLSSLALLGQHKFRIGTVNCPYSLGAIWARIQTKAWNCNSALSLFLGHVDSAQGLNNACMASNASAAHERSMTILELRSPMFGDTCICFFVFVCEVLF